MILKRFQLKELDCLYNKIVLNYEMASSNYTIFCNIKNIKKAKLNELKNQFKDLKLNSYIFNPNLVNIQIKNGIGFLNAFVLVVFAKNWNNLLYLVDLLNFDNIYFYYLHSNNFSFYMNHHAFGDMIKITNQIFNFNYILFRLIMRIIIIFFLLIKSFIFLIK